MNFLRSTLFMAILLVVTPPWAVIMMACFWLPDRSRRLTAEPWVRFALFCTRNLLGMKERVLGLENVPATAAVIACKHQSAWETIALQQWFPYTAFVFKKELLWLPFFGWALASIPTIRIDRKAGKDALNQLVDQGRKRLAQGFNVVVFPEGTRVAPGHKKRFKAGGALLAVRAGVPLVPVAHNAGELWRRNAFVKNPGVVTVSIGPPIDTTGLTAEEANRRAEAWIESEMRRISPERYGAA